MGSKRSHNQFEDQHLSDMARVPCVICALKLGMETPAEIHHCREEEGAAQRASHFLAIPLCREHHLGPTGLHGLGKRGFYTRWKMNELQLLAVALLMLTMIRMGKFNVSEVRNVAHY